MIMIVLITVIFLNMDKAAVSKFHTPSKSRKHCVLPNMVPSEVAGLWQKILAPNQVPGFKRIWILNNLNISPQQWRRSCVNLSWAIRFDSLPRMSRLDHDTTTGGDHVINAICYMIYNIYIYYYFVLIIYIYLFVHLFLCMFIDLFIVRYFIVYVFIYIYLYLRIYYIIIDSRCDEFGGFRGSTSSTFF